MAPEVRRDIELIIKPMLSINRRTAREQTKAAVQRRFLPTVHSEENYLECSASRKLVVVDVVIFGFVEQVYVYPVIMNSFDFNCAA